MTIDHQTPRHEPTPEEIEEQCKRIRAAWSDKEMRKRMKWQDAEPWTVPEYRCDDIGLDPNWEESR